jgi:hypothetical protein
MRYRLSYLCSSINLQVSLDFLYEFKLLVSFLSLFAKIECTYQDKNTLLHKRAIKSIIWQEEMNFE